MALTEQKGVREALMILLGVAGLYFFLALATYSQSDPAWSHSTASETANNSGGLVGAWFADVLYFLFGYAAFGIPLGLVVAAAVVFKHKLRPPEQALFPVWIRVASFVTALVAFTGLADLHFASATSILPANAGGILGNVAGHGLQSILSDAGATLTLMALFLAGVSLSTGMSWLSLMDAIGRLTVRIYQRIKVWHQDRQTAKKSVSQRVKAMETEVEKAKTRPAPKITESPKPEPVVSERREKEKQMVLFETPADMSLPSLSLLQAPQVSKRKLSTASLEAVARQVELKLKDFGVEVHVVAVYPGPVITRFELQPAPGVKGSQIASLSKDIARSLSVVSVRVVDVIPGKSVIGLEIPNEEREIVRLVEILQAKEYENASSPLVLALGKDIGGKPVVADLAKMPHLLVAGTTGSGKSVAVNAMILSVLYNATPKQARLIMIDPKMLELSIYDGIPHLLAPVVTDMKEAANALRWCVAEMERRYKLMAAMGVRNLAGFNRKIEEAIERKEPIKDPFFKSESGLPAPELETLPHIVVVIDELADMMMVVGKKVEELIARLAQKARAAGLHLILATQRPSVDVITGLIKANIPTRIAFQVSSKIDSRTIIDQMGAEALLGHGDMLYLAPGTGTPVRLHGAFVADEEVHAVVADLKKRGQPNYDERILSGDGQEPIPGLSNDGADGSEDPESDPLYDQAVEIVMKSRKASISNVQRRLKIGYNRAARLVEAMESAGLVSGPQHNGQREVLAPMEE